ncbi:class I SAM-dependent methyltransferase [Liquorilactobacillus mali]|uniref:16S RNA methylase n=1 Tax=Liquorilactobacillus mali KCTC 3596 = DSM 20444 TaxID=1046596 RepID=A0A0R2E0Y8_9LACO|nr:class I SAM-dependent methyltransferase [Liquorilactobacillus mali]KRN09880.1 16S RNA methylase [Liquorilactobacillus mali KCTC 3596 = DSM 20444]MDC7953287.1 class I SAM-dependent methyltransferase [Liquorilactobacillus mali]
MGNYYYSKNPEVVHEEKRWGFDILGNKISFVTDNGVFSKKTVDYGSRALINNLKIETMQEGRILDLGCGYGPIGLGIAKSNSKLIVDMVDVNELALSLAKKNAELNGLKNVNIWESNVYDKIERTDYNLILSNPPIRAGKKIVSQILAEAISHLSIGGRLVVVIQKKQGAPSAKKLMETVFNNCEVVARDKGYFILESIKLV